AGAGSCSGRERHVERLRFLLVARRRDGLAPAARQAAGLELADVAARDVRGVIEEGTGARRAHGIRLIARIIQRAFGHRPAYAPYAAIWGQTPIYYACITRLETL